MMKDEEEISRMLASLKAVDAPENFEGGVRSRIAMRREQPSLSRASLLLVAKFALPLLVLVGVGGFLIVSDNGTLQGDMVPPVGDGTKQDVAVFDEPPSGAGAPQTTGVNTVVAQAPVNRSGTNSRAVQPSQDQGLSQDDTTVFPDGVDPRKARVTNGQRPTDGQISLASVLNMIGISASCSAAGCVATEVREGSVAANAGVRAADLLVALDQQPINAATSLKGGISVNTITLVRDGNRMAVSIGRR